MDRALLTSTALNLVVDVVAALVILIIGWAVAGWAARTVRRIGDRSDRFDRTLVDLAARVFRWLVLVFVVVAVLGRFGIQTTSIVAVLGAAGLAVGLALQGTLSNVASGAMLLALRPFRLGDAVEIGSVGGSVEEMGLFATKLRGWDGVVVHLPNNAVWGQQIRNMSQATARRIDLEIGIGYGDDVGRALELTQGCLAEESRVMQDPAPSVTVEALGADAVQIRVRAWTAPADLGATRHDLLLALKHTLDDAGIDIPYPQRSVHITQQEPIRVTQVD